MSGYDHLGTPDDDIETAGYMAPTPIAERARHGVRTGPGSLTDYEPREIDRWRRGTIHVSSHAKHRQKRPTGVLWAYVYGVVVTTLGTAFVVQLAADLEAPAWLALLLQTVPGLCLASFGLACLVWVRWIDRKDRR